MPEDVPEDGTDNGTDSGPDSGTGEGAGSDEGARSDKRAGSDSEAAASTTDAISPRRSYLAPDPHTNAPTLRALLARFVRSRTAVGVVCALAGVLLSTGFMAYRADELPFVQRSACWGGLAGGDLDALLPEGDGDSLIPDDDTEVHELPLARNIASDDRQRAVCRVQRRVDDKLRWEFTAEVRELEEFYGRDAREWSREFLTARMAPLGGDTVGMASDSRAWVALPASCAGSADGPPTVVSLSAGRVDRGGGDPNREDAAYRDAMARGVVHLANGVMDEVGCEGRYPDPGKLPPLTEPKEVGKAETEALCGMKGVRLPRTGRDTDFHPRQVAQTPTDNGPARTCAAGQDTSHDGLRLTTVTDPRLAEAFSGEAYGGGKKLTGDGFGTSYGDFAVYQLTCQTGQVTFVARNANLHPREDYVDRFFPAFVKSEAKRIGCGEAEVVS